MVEIVLHQISGAEIQRERGEEIRVVGQEAVAQMALDLRVAIYDAIPEEGITPEEVFELVRVQAEWNRIGVAPHQFFLSIVTLLEGGFISASTRAVDKA